MSKGDQIHVVVEGVTGPLTTTARQAGRAVEFEFVKEGLVMWLVVREVTRGGTVVMENRYPTDQIRAMTRVVKEVVRG